MSERATLRSPPEPLADASEETLDRRIELHGLTLRQHAARGTIVNSIYHVGVSSLSLLRGFVVAGFLTASDFGVWGILIVGLGTLGWLKQVGISEKYIQQSDPDQELAFQKAFTLELLFNGLMLLVAAAAVPLIAVVYGQPRVLVPGFVLLLAIPAATLQAPVWVYYRQMDFVRQRTLQAVEPLVGFALTLGLAVAGAGYWSLVVGVVVGTWAGAVVALVNSRFRLALRYDHGTLRRYFSFSWPLFVVGLSGVVIAQGSILAGEKKLGLAGAGVIALASSISLYSNRVDAIITETLYPAICAIRDRTDVLFESFVKSNRLALIWAVPFGIGVALFAPDLVRFGLGHRWHAAVGLIQAFGLIAAINHIGFNWDAYFRARADTRPIAIVSVTTALAFLALAIPLLLTDGLHGFAIGMAGMAIVTLAARAFFLTRLFPRFRMFSHMARAIAPTLPAAAVVLAVRLVEPAARTAALAAAELALYLVVTVLATYLAERQLIAEVAGYLRRSPRARPA
jgi:lipopolysaccharide exporter